ncbi:MAG: HAD hydrolase family protein [Bacteroidales bacterium]|nr:HAD hydrolase family protein [Bacteroidales bacterium]
MAPNLKDIKAIAYDLDGVATDGSIIPVGPTMDDLIRVVNAKDSFASRFAAKQGFIMAVISGALTTALRSRCIHMGVQEENLYLGVRGKLKTFNEFCERNGLKPSEVAYFGDDIPDTQVLRACGFGIAPADAAEEARAAADYVTKVPGGRGCIREGIEMILKAQDKWKFDEDHFDQIY